MEELTNIEVIVMEDEDGNETEYLIADEFDFNGARVIALCPPADAAEDEDEVSFFLASGDGEEYDLMPIEDERTIDMLAGILEDRLLARS
ncbi:MAG: DUF1292 domain-containing protein [Christensenellales bacterium]|jgi:uncharacterized protein YrzB (UPF0473 family)